MLTHLQNQKYCSAFNLHISFCNIDIMITQGAEDFTVLGCDNYPIRVIILSLMRPNWSIMTLPSHGLFKYFPEVPSLTIWHHGAIQNISDLLAKTPIFCIDCWQSDVMLGKFGVKWHELAGGELVRDWVPRLRSEERSSAGRNSTCHCTAALPGSRWWAGATYIPTLCSNILPPALNSFFGERKPILGSGVW